MTFDTERDAFKEFYASQAAHLHAAADSLRTLVSLLLTDNDDFATPRVLARVKDRDECVKKFSRKYQASLEGAQTPYSIADHITDLVGLRVVCLYETDVDLIREVLIANFELIGESDKSEKLEATDALFGYKGHHLDLRLDAERKGLPEYKRFIDLRFEVQIRTIVQDAWSSVDHKIKYKRNIPNRLKRRINRLAALFELADQEFANIRDETARLEEEAKAATPPQAPPPAVEAPAPRAAPKLDPFAFIGVVQRVWPQYHFLGVKIDGFVEELRSVNPAITAAQVSDSLARHRDTLGEYKEYQLDRFRNRLNPYTVTRHALFLDDREKYAPLLFDVQRNNLLEWLDGSQE